jgi:putative membrane protein
MLLHHVVTFLAFTLAVFLAAKIVPGIRVKSFPILFALVFAVLNKLLFLPLVAVTLPFVVVTLGLFVFFINAFLFWLAGKIVSSVEVDGFGSALLGSLVTSGLNALILFGIHHIRM